MAVNSITTHHITCDTCGKYETVTGDQKRTIKRATVAYRTIAKVSTENERKKQAGNHIQSRSLDLCTDCTKMAYGRILAKTDYADPDNESTYRFIDIDADYPYNEPKKKEDDEA